MVIKVEKRRDGIFIADRITVEPEKGKRLDPADVINAFKLSAFDLDHVLSCYEAAARARLAGLGKTKGRDRLTVDLKKILSIVGEIRAAIAKGEARTAAWCSIMLCRAAMRAEIRPIEPAIRHRFRLSQSGKERAADIRREREREWKLWADCAEELQKKKAYAFRIQLARAVQRKLRIPESIETIRKRVTLKKNGKVL